MTTLQGQLSEAQAQGMQVQEVNDQLATENAELVGSNGQLLRRVREGEKRGEDLTQLLQIIAEGVAEGNLKVSIIINCSISCTSCSQYFTAVTVGLA